MSSTQKPSRKLMEALAVAAEGCGGDRMSDGAAQVMFARLSVYPEAAALKAIDRCMREVTGRLSLAAIIERIEDGRPSPDEAWATVGTRDESRTLVCTTEAMEAMEVCRVLLEADEVAARMAFRDRYKAIVTENRSQGIPAKWYASLGQDREGRAPVLAAAVQQGRLTAEYAAGLLGVAPEQLAGIAQGQRPQLAAPVAALIGKVASELSMGPPPCGKDPTCNGFRHTSPNGRETTCPEWGNL